MCCAGCSLSQFGKNFSEAVDSLVEISGLRAETVEIIVEETVRVEPAAIPTDTEKSLYCYRVLNSTQKSFYRVILGAVREMTEGFFELGTTGGDYNYDVSVAYQAVANDHPELFWMPYSYLINTSGDKSRPQVLIALSYNDGTHSCDYLADREVCGQMTALLDAAAQELAEAAAGLSRYEAELFFHDALCEQVEYVTGEPESMVYTAYGALVNGRAVCEGYSRAMQLLCQKLGIPCTLISGVSEGTGHLWNLIDPGDGWYHLDVTWDDNAEGAPYHLYFNLTDDEILRDRTISPNILETDGALQSGDSYNLRTDSCGNTAYNYFHYEGLIFDGDYRAQVPMKILEAAQRGECTQTFRFVQEADAERFEADYETYVAEIQKALDSLRSGVTVNNLSIIRDTVAFYW